MSEQDFINWMNANMDEIESGDLWEAVQFAFEAGYELAKQHRAEEEARASV